MFLGSILAYHWQLGSWWTFAALFLVPDLSMLGYLAGPSVGARAGPRRVFAPICPWRSRSRLRTAARPALLARPIELFIAHSLLRLSGANARRTPRALDRQDRRMTGRG